MAHRTNQTKTRESVMSVLKLAEQPLSLDSIHQQVRKRIPRVAFSTIYRVAKSLEASGGVTRVDWRERGSRYELTNRLPHHHHIVCTHCGRSSDIDSSTIAFDQSAIEAATGFRLNAHFIEFEGTCASCRVA